MRRKILEFLKHIGNSKNCKSYYGSRFNFLKHNQELERKSKYREIKREEINENQRKRREQEKDKKMYFCLQRDCIVMGRRKNLRIMKQSENKKKWLVNFAKRHLTLHPFISNKEECKLFYGSRLEEAVKEHARHENNFTDKKMAQKKN